MVALSGIEMVCLAVKEWRLLTPRDTSTIRIVLRSTSESPDRLSMTGRYRRLHAWFISLNVNCSESGSFTYRCAVYQ